MKNLIYAALIDIKNSWILNIWFNKLALRVPLLDTRTDDDDDGNEY